MLTGSVKVITTRVPLGQPKSLVVPVWRRSGEEFTLIAKFFKYLGQTLNMGTGVIGGRMALTFAKE